MGLRPSPLNAASLGGSGVQVNDLPNTLRGSDLQVNDLQPHSLRASDLRVNGIVEESIVDGPGLRFVVFTQGCPHACKGCHNPDTHSLDGGYVVGMTSLVQQFAENPLLAGITLSGGEPFLQAQALAVLAAEVRALGKTVLVYTGYVYEELLRKSAADPHIERLLGLTDILIDGPYVEALRNLDLPYRGSSNQRILTLNSQATA